MWKNLHCGLVLAVVSNLALHAQTTTDQISTGAGYSKFAYYKLSDGSSQQIPNEAWDIAFSNLNAQSAGVFINESTTSSMGQTVPGVEAYDPLVFDFGEVIATNSILPEQQIFNPETSWAEGAFNAMRDTTNALDFGWGYFDPTAAKVLGARVFVVKLRNGEFRKLIIDEFNGTQFSFRVAKLDGSNLTTHTISTDFGSDTPVVYFSLGASGSNVTTATGWDLVFQRYYDALDDGAGVFVNYPVTGILAADGVQTALAKNVDPATVDYNLYLDSFTNRLDGINHDWKFFNLSTGWIVSDDRAYFVKTEQHELYKLVFTAFGGATSGTATVQRTYLGQLTAAPDLPAGIGAVLVYPNPAAERLALSFTAKRAAAATLRLLNQAGQTVWTGYAQTQVGLNVLEINTLPVLPTGLYQLNVQLPDGQFTRGVVVGR